MSDTAASAVAARPRLERPREGRTVLGVCAALGRYTDVDPVIYRVILIALTIFGGFGAVLYAIGWLLIPEQGESDSVFDRVLHRHAHRLRTPIGVVLAVTAVVVLALVTAGSTRNVAVTVLLLSLVGYLVLRRQDHPLSQTAAPGTPSDTATATFAAAPPVAAATTAAPPAAAPDAPAEPVPPAEPPRSYAPPPYVPSPPKPPRPPRSRLGLITLSAALVVTGSLVAFRQAGVEQLTVPRILAVALGVIALGLIVGAWYGRAKWLAIPGAMLAIATVVAASVNVSVDGGVGDRQWAPTTASELKSSYHLGVGNGHLDLTALASDTGGFAPETFVDASVGVGRLEVVVPRTMTVEVSGHADAGDINVFGLTDNGVDSDVDATHTSPRATRVLHLDAEVGFGQIDVTVGGPHG